MDERVVAVGPGGIATVWPRLPERTASTPHAVANGFWEKLVVYDGGGRAWRVDFVRLEGGNGIVSRLRNARRQAALVYGVPQPYDLPELKTALRRALAEDDDVLTQFHDAAEIGEWLEGATTFTDVVVALRRAENE